MDLTPFRNLVKDSCGFSFNEIRTSILENSIRKRMSERRMESSLNYLKLLTENRDEFCELVSLLTVNETYFYREPAHLELLAAKIVPDLLANKKPGEKIKIISAGCSTGEEPYSIIMKLMEKYGTGIHNLVSVIGFDIDNYALAAASKGLYSNHSFRDFPCDLKHKYFDGTADGSLRIRDFVRESVHFLELNLVNERYPDDLRDSDIIFYRNVSIYFEPDLQKQIFRNLSSMLTENGYLLVGSTETLSHDIGILSLVEMDRLFVYRKRNEIRFGDRRKNNPRPAIKSFPGVADPRPRVPAPACRVKPEPAERRDKHELFDKALESAKVKRYEEALLSLDELLKQDPGFTKAYTLKGGILINIKRLDEAEAACLQSICLDQWCLEAYLLLGFTARLKNDDEAASKRFKEALYVQSSCWLAHFYLAEIYRARSEAEAACREYEIAVKLLKKGDVSDHGLVFFPLSFQADQITHLCNHNLAMLKKEGAR